MNTLAPPTENRMLGIGLRLLAVFFITIMAAFVKLANEQSVHVIESLFWRQLSGLPIVFIWLKIAGSLSDIGTKQPWSHSWRMILGLCGMALNYTAMTMLPLAESATIGFAIPIFSAVLAAIILKEQTGIWRWSAVAVGFIGVLIVVQPGEALHSIGALVALGGAFMTAAVTIQVRTMSRTETTGAIVFWFSLTSLIPLGIMMIFVGQNHNALAWAYIAGLSISGSLAQICMTSSLRFAPVSVVMPMDYSALIWSTFYGWLLFDQLPAASTWQGAPLVIGAGVVIAWREHHLHVKARAATTASPSLDPDGHTATLSNRAAKMDKP